MKLTSAGPGNTLRGFCLRVLVALAALAPTISFAVAHELTPAIGTLDFHDEGNFDLELSVNLEALIAAIGPQHENSSASPNAAEYDRLRALLPSDLEKEYATFQPRLRDGISLTDNAGNRVVLKDGPVSIAPVGDLSAQRLSSVRFSGRVPFAAKTLRWHYDPSFGPSVIRARIDGGEIFYSNYVLNGETSDEIDIQAIALQSRTALIADYVRIGFHHIVPTGVDHILFVVGLFLLSPKLKPLLWQITCFTIAHSLTLALGGLGIIRLPASIVEPLIALSIVYVAAENLWTDRLNRSRPLVIFLFGLIHGVGFAGVLTDVGLNGVDFLLGLIAFNVGVEVGQLAIIAGCYLAIGLWFGEEAWYRRWVTVPASLVVAAIGAFWFVERIV